MTTPGFVFWGVFVSFAVIVAGYVVWMVAAERHEDRARSSRPGGPRR